LDEPSAESGGDGDTTTSESERRHERKRVLTALALPDRVAPMFVERISRGSGAKAGSEFTQTRALLISTES
jgi:hypothetical protein